MAIDSPATMSRRTFLAKTGAAAAGAAGLSGCRTIDRFAHRSGRKTVRLWHLLSSEWLEPCERAVKRFNESQGRYEVVPLLLPSGEADSKLLISAAGADPPDVMLVWSQITSSWASANIIQPLDPFMSAAEKQLLRTNAYPVVARSGYDHGKLYGLTHGFDLFVIYYRPDIFRSVGLDPDRFPETLEEMTAIADKMNTYDSTGSLTRVGYLPQTFQYNVPLFGGNLYDAQTGKVTLNTPENLRALEYMVDVRTRLGLGKEFGSGRVQDLDDARRKQGLENVLRFTSGLPTDSGAAWPFISGSYGMTLDGEWRVEQLRRYAPQLEYRTIPIPPPKGGKSLASFSMINYLVIPKQAREPEGAWAFMKFWTGLENPERAAEFFPWYGWMPVLRRSENTEVYQNWLKTVPQYRTLLRVAKSDNIVTTPPVPYQTYLMDRITDFDQLAMRGTLSPRQALINLEQDIQAELVRRKGLGYVDGA
jgi:multiple sugar transport system substrate-binding protein